MIKKNNYTRRKLFLVSAGKWRLPFLVWVAAMGMQSLEWQPPSCGHEAVSQGWKAKVIGMAELEEG